MRKVIDLQVCNRQFRAIERGVWTGGSFGRFHGLTVNLSQHLAEIYLVQGLCALYVQLCRFPMRKVIFCGNSLGHLCERIMMIAGQYRRCVLFWRRINLSWHLAGIYYAQIRNA